MTEHITHTPTVRRLERSSSDKMLAGVCGGLGRYFELNPTVFRVGFVVLTLLGGAGVLVYLAAALVMPGEGKEHSLAEQVLAERKERPWPLIGLAIAGTALIVLLSRAALRPEAGAGWIFVLVVGLVVLWVSRSARWGGRLLKSCSRSPGSTSASATESATMSIRHRPQPQSRRPIDSAWGICGSTCRRSGPARRS
jgi:phage shock protein PspC (stress-responsive transcriptional regulator)